MSTDQLVLECFNKGQRRLFKVIIVSSCYLLSHGQINKIFHEFVMGAVMYVIMMCHMTLSNKFIIAYKLNFLPSIRGE